VRFSCLFRKPGIHVVKLRIYSAPRLFTEAKKIIKIGKPTHSVQISPGTVKIVPNSAPPYNMPVTIVFTSRPLIPSGRWYVNRVFIRTGDIDLKTRDAITFLFKRNRFGDFVVVYFLNIRLVLTGRQVFFIEFVVKTAVSRMGVGRESIKFNAKFLILDNPLINSPLRLIAILQQSVKKRPTVS
jgi:hypothetical protein